MQFITRSGRQFVDNVQGKIYWHNKEKIEEEREGVYHGVAVVQYPNSTIGGIFYDKKNREIEVLCSLESITVCMNFSNDKRNQILILLLKDWNRILFQNFYTGTGSPPKKVFDDSLYASLVAGTLCRAQIECGCTFEIPEEMLSSIVQLSSLKYSRICH